MTTIVSRSRTTDNNYDDMSDLPMMHISIPREIRVLSSACSNISPSATIENGAMYIKTVSPHEKGTSSYDEPAHDMNNLQTVWDTESLGSGTNSCESSVFHGGIISLTSDCNSSDDHESINMTPLDFRMDWCKETEETLRTVCAEDTPDLFSDAMNMSIYDDCSMCSAPPDWEMETLCSVFEDDRNSCIPSSQNQRKLRGKVLRMDQLRTHSFRPNDVC